MTRLTLFFFSFALASPLFAAHIVTETRDGSTPIHRTDTYANAAGDLRMEERGYGFSSTTSSDAAASSANTSVETNAILGNVDDITLYQSNGDAIVMLEGDICRRLTADSEPPPGLGIPGMNMGEHNKQMAEAMKQAGSAFEDAMRQAEKEGMDADQRRALENFAKPFMEAPDMKPRNTLQIEALGTRTTVGKYSAEGYLITDLDENEKHRVWVIPNGDIAGGRDVTKAMHGMYKVYEKYLENMGGSALMDTGIASMFEGELEGMYPVRIEDLSTGHITDVIEAHAGGPTVDYYPDCEAKNMFGM